MAPVEAAEDVRDAILDAAEALLARHGFQKATMEALAQEVGIGKGSTYLHFESKEHVFLATVDRIVDRLLARAREVASSTDPASERLRRVLIDRVLFRFDSVRGYRQGLDGLLASLRPALLDRRLRYFEEEAEVIAGILRAGRAAGELAFDDDIETARALVLATNALLPYALSASELGRRADVARRAERIVQLLLQGLVSRDAPRARGTRRPATHRGDPR
ncbi:MAG: TetR/AcrR family transcriptional regulator [Planctomycetes bacterium]|nr:TetR/AcrR family transcriptional regulator [Planctomycetota bacterium]MBI3846241.1 TetR/AcrR family transcriptional regulator [Planctomycetota bacterium]